MTYIFLLIGESQFIPHVNTGGLSGNTFVFHNSTIGSVGTVVIQPQGKQIITFNLVIILFRVKCRNKPLYLRAECLD